MLLSGLYGLGRDGLLVFGVGNRSSLIYGLRERLSGDHGRPLPDLFSEGSPQPPFNHVTGYGDPPEGRRPDVAVRLVHP